MTTFSIIQKPQLEGASRLDAEYYQPEFIKIANIVLSKRNKELNELTYWIKKGIFDLSPDNYRGDGVPFIRTLEINDPLVDFSETVFLDKDIHLKHKTTTLSPGDLVFTKIGANIGKSAILPAKFNEYNFSQNVAGAKVKQDSIDSGYLLAYLLSKFGSVQIDRAQMISGQSKLELEDLRRLKIILPGEMFQREVNNLITQSQVFKDESIAYYLQAENLLLEKLDLDDFKVPEDLSYVVNYLDTEKLERVDADYFQPKYEKLVIMLKKKNIKKFSEVIEEAPARFVPKPDENYKYVELANINSTIGAIDGFSEMLGKDAPSRARRLLKTGDVLVSSIQGSLEKTALVDADQDRSLASTGFFQLRSNEILPEALLVLAKSVVLQWQLERECAGTILSAVPQESLKRLVIPTLLMETQQKIADLVRKSHEARKKSKELLEEAKRKVEEMIEKGGE